MSEDKPQCKSFIPSYIIPPHEKHKIECGQWMMCLENSNFPAKFIRYTDDDCFIGVIYIEGIWRQHKLLGCQFRPATDEEIKMLP